MGCLLKMKLKKHKLSGAHSIEEFGIASFNEECRKIVLRYTEEWKETVRPHGSLGGLLEDLSHDGHFFYGIRLVGI